MAKQGTPKKATPDEKLFTAPFADFGRFQELAFGSGSLKSLTLTQRYSPEFSKGSPTASGQGLFFDGEVPSWEGWRGGYLIA